LVRDEAKDIANWLCCSDDIVGDLARIHFGEMFCR